MHAPASPQHGSAYALSKLPGINSGVGLLPPPQAVSDAGEDELHQDWPLLNRRIPIQVPVGKRGVLQRSLHVCGNRGKFLRGLSNGTDNECAVLLSGVPSSSMGFCLPHLLLHRGLNTAHLCCCATLRPACLRPPAAAASSCCGAPSWIRCIGPPWGAAAHGSCRCRCCCLAALRPCLRASSGTALPPVA